MYSTHAGAGAALLAGAVLVNAASAQIHLAASDVAASYPGAGAAKVSATGVVGAPGTFHHQGWYRSANPTFCTPSTYNLTHGVVVT